MQKSLSQTQHLQIENWVERHLVHLKRAINLKKDTYKQTNKTLTNHQT